MMKTFGNFFVFFVSLLFLISCQTFGPAGGANSVHVISHSEEPSRKVQEDLSKPYTSSYGAIPLANNKQVDKWINYFQTLGYERMRIYLSRSSRYIPMMKQVFREYDLPEELVYAAMIESGFSPQARSFANAVGYWQFIAGTAKRYGLKIDHYVDERRDPVLSTRAAAQYFKDLYGIFGSWHLALASYNAGEYRINRFVMRHYSRNFWLLSSKRSFPKETANYVPKFIAALRISQNPRRYGFKGVEYQPALEYDTLALHFPISLKKLSAELDVSYQEMQRLNPSYRGEYVPAVKGVVLRIPAGRPTMDPALLTACKMEKPKIRYRDYYWYRVRRGDTLYRLARKNRTSISTIRRMNRMSRRNILRAGRKIKIPQYNRVVRTRRGLASVHIVKRGENLSGIAKLYGVKVQGIKKINRLKTSVLHPGQVLNLISRQQPQKKASPGGKFHVVQKGETLIGIAKRYDVSLPALMKKNTLNFQSILSAGKKIIIP